MAFFNRLLGEDGVRFQFITVGDYKLGFFGLHHPSNPQDEYSNARRMAEADVARRATRSEIVNRGNLPIVLGDLNDYDPDVPDHDETRETSTTVLRDLKDFDAERPGPELVNVAKHGLNARPTDTPCIGIGMKRGGRRRRRIHDARSYSASPRMDVLRQPGLHLPHGVARHARSLSGRRRFAFAGG